MSLSVIKEFLQYKESKVVFFSARSFFKTSRVFLLPLKENKILLILSFKSPFNAKRHCFKEDLKMTFLLEHKQSDLCTMTTLGTPTLWPLWTGGRCSNWDSKMMVAVGRWSLAQV
jgi:hypothetical protein